MYFPLMNYQFSQIIGYPVTSVLISKLEQGPGVLEALVSVVSLTQHPEPDRTGGQGRGRLASQVRARAAGGDTERRPDTIKSEFWDLHFPFKQSV